jgi:hypothetical protein
VESFLGGPKPQTLNVYALSKDKGKETTAQAVDRNHVVLQYIRNFSSLHNCENNVVCTAIDNSQANGWNDLGLGIMEVSDKMGTD